MPRSFRYFPVNQDINADPEVWELTDRFGDRAIRVWLEILSIADRNQGFLPGPWERYPSILAGRCKSTTRHLRVVCEWVTRWLEVDSQGVARVRNYSKYHKLRAEKKTPSFLTYPSEPNLKDKKKNKIAFPPTFEITPELRQWSLEKHVDPDSQLEAFRDYHVSHASRFLDWDAAFRNWIRRSVEFNRNGNGITKLDQEREARKQNINAILKRGL